ncbi:MAG: tetratricopeptide repeat protein [Bacteroidales bacterium]
MIRFKTHRIISVLVIAAGLLSLYSCSTKKNTFTRRLYHNITGHYNMYWNGRESFREGVDQLEKQVQDNYYKILPVYNFGTEQHAQSLSPYMDKAIEKASYNIQDHSMYFKRREWVRKIDDSYLLIGMAYFYKQEYHKARRTFEFVITEYKDNDTKWDAMLWLAKTYIEMGQFNRAESALDNLKNELDRNPKSPSHVKKEVPLAMAHMLILQERYGQAKQPLIDALFMIQKRKIDTRIRFILAQIYQYEGELYRASSYYQEVIRKNPPYEMAFNAAINQARSYDARFDEGSRDIVRTLNKMLKEDKNINFKDQIYFALSDVAFKDTQDSLAIDYLRLSVATSVNNNFQKSLSALKLGDIYFLMPDYELAQAYYDTAVSVLPEDFPKREEILSRTMNLTELVGNYIVIQTEDSLQMVAAMSEDDRIALIDKIIEEVIEEEKKQKEKEELLAFQQSLGGTTTQPGDMGISGASGEWYFYNTTALSYGYSEFSKKWGNRKLEDNWRLSNKQAIMEMDDPELAMVQDSLITDTTSTVVVITSNDPHTHDFYLQNLPLTEAQLLASDKKIEDAWFSLGMIYQDKLENLPKAAESFENLLSRFPESEYRLMTYYHLFRLYTNLENPDSAVYYKALIINDFPESDYALLLLDPDYFKELEARKNRAMTLYSETYNHYQSGHYYTVFTNSNRALSEFAEPEELMARFEYLRALSLGKIEVADSLKVALEALIVKYPNSEVKPLAQNILDYLSGSIDTTGSRRTAEPEEVIDFSIYSFNPRSKQLFALVVDGPNVNINALKVRISDYNKKYFSLDNLTITNILLDKTTHFIMVGNFDTMQEGIRYYNGLMSDDYVFANLEEWQYNGFVISQENYPVFYRDKDIEKYLAFFKRNYPINK